PVVAQAANRIEESQSVFFMLSGYQPEIVESVAANPNLVDFFSKIEKWVWPTTLVSRKPCDFRWEPDHYIASRAACSSPCACASPFLRQAAMPASYVVRASSRRPSATSTLPACRYAAVYSGCFASNSANAVADSSRRPRFLYSIASPYCANGSFGCLRAKSRSMSRRLGMESC